MISIGQKNSTEASSENFCDSTEMAKHQPDNLELQL